MPILGIFASQNYPRALTVDYLVVAGGGAGGGAVPFVTVTFVAAAFRCAISLASSSRFAINALIMKAIIRGITINVINNR